MSISESKSNNSNALLEKNKKMAELILYISKKSEGDETFGSTKLNKLLFYSDFTSYLKSGKAITNSEYMRLNHGPAPKQLVPIRAGLESAKDLYLAETKFFTQHQQKPIALRAADLSVFDAAEIVLVDEVIQKFWGMSASQISELSHEFIGWRLAKEKEIIPYSVARIQRREPSLKEVAYAKQLTMGRKNRAVGK